MTRRVSGSGNRNKELGHDIIWARDDTTGGIAAMVRSLFLEAVSLWPLYLPFLSHIRDLAPISDEPSKILILPLQSTERDWHIRERE